MIINRAFPISPAVQHVNSQMIKAIDPSIPEACWLGAWAYHRDGSPPCEMVGRYRYFEHKKTDADMVMLATRTTAYILLPGTESLTDLRNDLRFWEVPCYGRVKTGESKAPFCVQYGFLNPAMHLVNVIKKQLEHVDFRGLPITFVGHSLGGSIAEVLAHDFLFSNPSRRVKLVSMGVPPTGDEVFNAEIVQLIESGRLNYYRMVFRGDGVSDITGRDQGGTLIFADRNGNLYKAPPPSFYRSERRWSRLSDVVKLRFSRLGDHSAKNYANLFSEVKHG